MGSKRKTHQLRRNRRTPRAVDTPAQCMLETRAVKDANRSYAGGEGDKHVAFKYDLRVRLLAGSLDGVPALGVGDARGVQNAVGSEELSIAGAVDRVGVVRQLAKVDVLRTDQFFFFFLAVANNNKRATARAASPAGPGGIDQKERSISILCRR